MTQLKEPLVIVGTGLAGYLFAKAWRRYDTSTPLYMITQDDGAFYSKPLLSRALAAQKSPDDLVTTDVDTMAKTLNASILTYSTVTAIDRAQHRVDYHGKSIGDTGHLTYGKLVLACGVKPRHIPIEGDTDQAIVSVNNLSNYRYFRQWLEGKKHIAILGSGLVGVEFAHDLAEAGFKVTVISLDPQAMACFVPAEIGQPLQDALHTQLGIDWRFGVTLQAVKQHASGGFQLQLSDQTHFQADGVLSAVGLEANLHLAKQTGLKTKRAIVVGSDLATNDPDIYALGDCAEVEGDWRCYVPPIRHCSEVLAKNLGAGENARVNYPPMAVTLKTARYPVSFCVPPPDQAGEWHIAEAESNRRAEYRDAQGILRGFVVSGDWAKSSMTLLSNIGKDARQEHVKGHDA